MGDKSKVILNHGEAPFTTPVDSVDVGVDDPIELQVAEVLADMEDARRTGRPNPLEYWIERYPEAAQRIREAATVSAFVDSVIDHTGVRMHVAPDQVDVTVPALELEDFEIRRIIQSGAMGVVYEAVQRSTRRRVALKTLPEGLLLNPRRRKLFEREVEAVAGLQHPNIVPIYSSGLAKGQYFFAMQYVEGRHLDDYVHHLIRDDKPAPAHPRNHRVPVREIVRIMVKVCHAVHYAHFKGIIHRDLKPSNIIVDASGEPHLVDFGLAKVLNTDAQRDILESAFTLGGQVFGTLPYLAPEQARAQGDEIDVRTDVYALGVVLYKLLTDQYPYKVKGPLRDVLDNIQNTEPKSPVKALMDRGMDAGLASRTINDDLRLILMTALSKVPVNRYQSVAELGAELDRYLAGEPILAQRRARWLYLTKKYITRQAFPITLTFLIVVLAGALVWRLRMERDPPNTPSVTIDSAVKIELEKWKQRELNHRELALAMLKALLTTAYTDWRAGDHQPHQDAFLAMKGVLNEYVRTPYQRDSFVLVFHEAVVAQRASVASDDLPEYEAFVAWCCQIFDVDCSDLKLLPPS